jgi:LacI family transcriptional regulator
VTVTAGRGRNAPRMSDVATHAGVALGTVSNVLNRPTQVAPATRRRVEASIAALGFVPNRAARSLAAGTSTTIGFVVTDLSNSFFVDMTRGAEREAEASGLAVLLANTDMREGKQRSHLALFSEERMAGILLAPLPGTAEEELGRRRPGQPIVMLNNDEVTGACTVGVDDELGGYLATKHLLDLGRRRLVFAGDPALARPVQRRLAGARRAVAETSGVAALEVMPTVEIQVDDGRRVGYDLLGRNASTRPDGVVAAADLLALGIVQVLRGDSVLRIPGDIAVTGYDDNRSAWDSLVPITTLAQPGAEMGAAAVRLLLDELRASDDAEVEHEHRHEVLKPSLVPRASSIGS